MAAATEDWSRPAFEPGGGDASLFYLAFGELALVRLPPTPAGLSLTVHPQGESRLWVDALVAAARDDAEDSGLAAVVRGVPDFAVLRGHRVDPPDLVHLRDAESVLAALLEAGAVALLDVEAQRWWTPDAFRARSSPPCARPSARMCRCVPGAGWWRPAACGRSAGPTFASTGSRQGRGPRGGPLLEPGGAAGPRRAAGPRVLGGSPAPTPLR